MSAAPVATVFLILALLSLLPLKPNVGFWLLNPIPMPTPPLECWEEGYVVVSLLKDHALALNGIRTERSELFGQIRQKFQTRTQRVLFMEADSTLTVSEVVQFLDACQEQLPDVSVAIFPRSLQVNRWCPWFPSRSGRQ